MGMCRGWGGEGEWRWESEVIRTMVWNECDGGCFGLDVMGDVLNGMYCTGYFLTGAIIEISTEGCSVTDRSEFRRFS